MRHLSDEEEKKLSRGDPDALSYFSEHLQRECEPCEAWLAANEGGSLLDGLTDATLARVSPGATSDEGYAQVRRRAFSKGSRSAIFSAIGGVLACLLLVVVIGRVGPAAKDDGYTGEKGAAHVQLELQLAWQDAQGNLHRVENGAVLPPEGRLLFRYHSSEALTGKLLKQTERDSHPQLLGEVPLESGTHDLGSNAQVLGMDLSDEQGPTTFILESAPLRGEPARAKAFVQITSPKE